MALFTEGGLEEAEQVGGRRGRGPTLKELERLAARLKKMSQQRMQRSDIRDIPGHHRRQKGVKRSSTRRTEKSPWDVGNPCRLVMNAGGG